MSPLRQKNSHRQRLAHQGSLNADWNIYSVWRELRPGMAAMNTYPIRLLVGFECPHCQHLETGNDFMVSDEARCSACKTIIPFSDVLPDDLWERLDMARDLIFPADEEACRECGCTQNDPCQDGCFWVGDTAQHAVGLEPLEGALCSRCFEAMTQEKTSE